MRGRRIAILGAGSWGTALAMVLAHQDEIVSLWSRDPAQTAAIAFHGENRRDLPGARLPAAVWPTSDPHCVRGASLLLVAVPAQAVRAVLSALPKLEEGTPVIVCAKGIEHGSGCLLSEVVRASLPGHPPVSLSGPSFAADVARGRPPAVTIAAARPGLSRDLAERLARPNLRLYHTTDLVGVEIGGAAKNVLAIACGMAAGLDLGASASAALVARGFAELARFGLARGARPETMMGLSGLGDLVLTCSSAQSRNFAFGQALGRGVALAEASRGPLAEGVATAPVLCRLAEDAGVDMPICGAVADIVAGDLTPAEAVRALLSRAPKGELAF